MLFDIPKNKTSIIKVIGVGGGGGNAVGHMYAKGIEGVDFAICNTDSQALENNTVQTKIQLGPQLTDGRGAGTKPDVGKQACIESIEEVRTFLADGTKMLFITAGMGGGTGTGAAPIIAKAAKEMDILTVAIVTLPFKFEGHRRQKQALEGLENLKQNVDSILVISNDKMSQIFGDLALSDAFAEADEILTTAAKGIAEIITVPGYVNVDFEDVNTVMRDSGVAIMGSGLQKGDDRARKAIHQALNSPLLEDNDIRGAQHILLNIRSGSQNEVTMAEIREITEYVQEEAGYGTDLIWGNCKEESLDDQLSITLIATGFSDRKYVASSEDEDIVMVSLDDSSEANNIPEIILPNLKEQEMGFVVDFEEDDVKKTVDKLTQYDTRYQEESPEEKQKRMQVEAARRKYMRENYSKPLDTPRSINEFENTPAYLRRNVELDEGDASNTLSRFTVSMDEENPIQKTNNQFLHDNVD